MKNNIKTEYAVGLITAAFLLALNANGKVSQFISNAGIGFIAGYLATKLANLVRWLLLRLLLTYTGWVTNTKSRKTKIFGLLLKLVSPKNPKLFDYQKVLPRLPLPTLEETCSRILDIVRPLITKEELPEMKNAIKELLEVDGPKLHSILEKRYKIEPNWLEEYWEKSAYLSARCPLPVNLNYAMVNQLDLSGATESSRIANYTYYAMKYKHKIETNELSPLRIMNLIPICMDRCKSLFSCTRVPGEHVDEMKYYNSNHIVVFRNGHMYRVDMYCQDYNGKKVLMSPLAIQRVFEGIIKNADQKVVLNPAPFTTMERTEWFKLRCTLLKSERNASSLEDVESAAFCVSLDTDNEAQEPSSLFHEFLMGDSYHRWFDKSLVIIGRPNSAVGLNCEHTSAEATLYARLWEYQIASQKYDAYHNAFSHEGLNDDLRSTPKELEWELEGLENNITTAADAYDKLCSNVDCSVHFAMKGKGIIKRLRIAPDGFIQMALQLAFYRLHKTTPKTYETGSARMYYHGRTETIRSVSDESVLFTKTFDDPSISHEEKVSHLQAAVKHQTKQKHNATTGKGIDRHLLALYVNGKMSGKVPKIFSLKPFSETDRLSTSQSPMCFDSKVTQRDDGNGGAGGGFGPQHSEGYGVAYFMAGEDKIYFIISSYKTFGLAKTFALNIDRAIDDQIKILSDFRNQQRKSGNDNANGNIEANNTKKMS